MKPVQKAALLPLFLLLSASPTLALSEGDLVINEIMKNPQAVSDNNGEWFELYNLTNQDINLAGVEVKDSGTNQFLIEGDNPILIPALGFFVLGRNADPNENGGVNINYQYPGFQLGNNNDEIIISKNGVEIDRVEYDNDNFPNFFGTSAAAPHAAAVAALVLEANPSLLPTEVYAVLEETALDMDDPSTPGFDIGFDFVSGYGFIQADDALEAAVPACLGDFNDDRIVDKDDLNIFAANFGLDDCGEDCPEDLDLDDDVDGDDLSKMGRQLEDGCN